MEKLDHTFVRCKAVLPCETLYGLIWGMSRLPLFFTFGATVLLLWGGLFVGSGWEVNHLSIAGCFLGLLIDRFAETTELQILPHWVPEELLFSFNG